MESLLPGPSDPNRRQVYRVDRRAVSFIRFIFEAYDGIAVVETIEPRSACIALHVAPGCEPDVAALVSNLQRDHRMEPVFQNQKGDFSNIHE
jgi:hypothetical protein